MTGISHGMDPIVVHRLIIEAAHIVHRVLLMPAPSLIVSSSSYLAFEIRVR